MLNKLNLLYINHIYVLYNKRGIPIKNIITTETTLIPYGNIIESTIGLELTPSIRNNTYLPKYILEMIIGLLLGDGCLTISNTSKNASFIFVQSIKRFNYGWHIFEELKFLCQSIPRLDKSIRNNSITYSL